MKMVINLKSSFLWVLVLFVLTIPLNNLYEVLAMMKGELSWGGWSSPLTPVYIKLIKDLFVVVAGFFAVLRFIKTDALIRVIVLSPKFSLVNLFVFIFLVVSVFSFSYMPAEYVLFGVRGYWCVLLVYVGACFYDVDERQVCRVVYLIFVLHFIIQLVQSALGSGYPVYGEFRSPGVFMIPATAGAFSLLVFYFAETFKNKVFMGLSVISLVLSASTMGLIVLCAYLSYKLFYRFRKHYELLPFVAVAVFSVCVLFVVNIDVVSGRGDAVYSSFMIRMGYITSVLEDFSTLTWGLGMGIATSQAVMSGLEGAVVADNTYTGTMLNLGWVAATVLLLFVLSSFFYFRSKLLFFIFFGYSMTTVVFELNPIIQLLMLLLGMQMMQQAVSSRAKNITIGLEHVGESVS